MTCDEIMDLMQRSLDNDLTAAEEQVLLAHLHVCPNCTDLYERLKHLSDELLHLPKVMPPYSIVDSILPRLEELDGFMEQGVAMDKLTAAPEPETVNASQPSDELEVRRKRKGIFSWKIASGVAAAGIVLGVLLLNGGAGRLSNQAAEGLLDEKMQKFGVAATSAGAATDRSAPAAAADLNAAAKNTGSLSGKKEAEASPQASSSATAAAKDAAAKPDASSAPTTAPAAQTAAPAHTVKEVTAASSGEALRSAESSTGADAQPPGDSAAAKAKTEVPTQSSLASPSEAPASTPAAKNVEPTPAPKEAAEAPSAASAAAGPNSLAPSPEEKYNSFNAMRSLVPPAAAASGQPMTSADGRYTASVADQAVRLTLTDGSLWFQSPIRIGEGDLVTFHGWSEGIFVYSIKSSDGQERTYRIVAETKTEVSP